MAMYEEKVPQGLRLWIASLAASTLICTAFAGYLFDIKADLANSKIRDDILEQRLDMLASQIDNLRRHAVVEQLQIAPPDGTIQIPTTVTVSPSVGTSAPALPTPPVPPANMSPSIAPPVAVPPPAPAAPVKP